MRIFRFLYIIFLPLIILTCNGGGDGDGNGLPGGEDFSDYEYENEISLTFSGSFSEFNETQFKNDVAASTGATLDQIQITDSGLIQRDGFYVSFIFIESQIILTWSVVAPLLYKTYVKNKIIKIKIPE